MGACTGLRCLLPVLDRKGQCEYNNTTAGKRDDWLVILRPKEDWLIADLPSVVVWRASTLL
jgi:hypothetical protein